MSKKLLGLFNKTLAIANKIHQDICIYINFHRLYFSSVKISKPSASAGTGVSPFTIIVSIRAIA